MGKTSILNRFASKKFDDNSMTTLGASFVPKIIVKGEMTYKFQVQSRRRENNFFDVFSLHGLSDATFPVDLGHCWTRKVSLARTTLLQRYVMQLYNFNSFHYIFTAIFLAATVRLSCGLGCVRYHKQAIVRSPQSLGQRTPR